MDHLTKGCNIKLSLLYPSYRVDWLMSSSKQNGGMLSNPLAQEVLVQWQPGIWDAIVEAENLVWQKSKMVSRFALP